MTLQTGKGTDGRLVVGYFSAGGDACRAIHELMDEGFRAAEIGAAFRGRREEISGVGGIASGTEAARGNPALTGSVGGPGSHDQAVTPAGLAPGAGAAFPAPGAKGPIPGAEIPETLPHDLPRTLPSTLRGETETTSSGRRGLSRDVTETSSGPRLATRSSQKFGTGEGHLGLSPQHRDAYSEPAFENSFVGMGLGANEARSLSAQLSRGGAVISVSASARASLAEAILERNHGRIRFETAAEAQEEMDHETPVEIYGSMCGHYRPEEGRRRRAS